MQGKIKFFLEFENAILDGLVDYVNTSTTNIIQDALNNSKMRLPDQANLFNAITQSNPVFLYLIPKEDTAGFKDLLLRMYDAQASKQKLKNICLRIFDGMNVKPEDVKVYPYSYNSVLNVQVNNIYVAVSRFSIGNADRHMFTFVSSEPLSMET